MSLSHNLTYAMSDNSNRDVESPSYGRVDRVEPSNRVIRTRRDTLKGLFGVGTGVALFGNAGLGSASTEGKTEYDNLCFTPTTVLAERIRTGELSSEHLVEVFLDRIERHDDDINAFVTLTLDRAREAAREADRAVERGEDLGPLHGVPFANKDTYPVEGVRHTDGSLLFEDRIAEENEQARVQKFLDAGAILLGTVSTPEFGHMGKTDNLLVGPTSTPFDLDQNAGGSSGGSAAAVADGLVPFATGGDAGGSIRIPASFTGTYGLFPAADNPGDFGSPTTFSQAGVQTRTVEDTAYLLSIMNDEDETDYLGPLDEDVNGLSVGYDLTPGGWPVDERVRTAVEENVGTIADHGAHIEPVDIDFRVPYNEVVDAMTIIWSGSAVVSIAASLEEEFDIDITGEDSDLFTEYFVERVEEGRQFTGPDGELTEDVFLRTVDVRTKTFLGFQNAFENHDLLVIPTVSTVPFSNDILGPTEVDGVDTHPVYGWLITAVFNLIGLPAASVPAGLTTEGLPVGLQIVGPPLDTESVITASAAYERANPWHDNYPGL